MSDDVCKCGLTSFAAPEVHDRTCPMRYPEGALIKCPGCDLKLASYDLRGQVDHMDANHPEIIASRMKL